MTFEAMQATAAQRRSEGLCGRCGAAPLFTAYLCNGCRNKVVVQQRQRRAMRRADGLCDRCGCPPLDGTNYCAPCRRRCHEASTAFKRRARSSQQATITKEQAAALTVSWQQGDRWAGGELLREYERFIHSQTPRMPSNAAYGSDDAAQNTRIVFLDRLMTWKPDQDASPLTYLCECHLKSASYRESATARYPVALPVHLVAFLCAELRGWRSVATLGEVMALLPTWSGTRGGDGENLVSSETIEAAMSAIARPMYLDGPPDDRAPPPDDDMDPAGHFLVDPQPTPEDRMVELDATATMRAFLAAPDIELSPRERVILYERITAEEPLTLKEIGARFNCTRERIRQVEKALLKRLRQRFGAPLDVSEDDEISE